jgi:DNA mismatch endonuclease (patch repair protein)
MLSFKVMADIFSSAKRSEVMSRIKNKGSALERFFESELKKIGLRYRKHVSSLPGKPDFIFPDKKAAVFIDSCFWHGCRYHGTLPKSNRKFWKEKIARNKSRDKKVTGEYKKMGWSIMRIWEHKLKSSPSQTLKSIIDNLNLMLK